MNSVERVPHETEGRGLAVKSAQKSNWLCLAALVLIPALLWGQGRERPDATGYGQTHARVTGSPTHAVLSINNLTLWMQHDGQSNRPPSGAHGVQLYPPSGGTLVYRDGFVWGGIMYLDAAMTRPAPEQMIRVGGGDHRIGTRAGRIVGSGASAVAEDTAAGAVRIYRIRRDYYSMDWYDLQQDARSVFETTVNVSPSQEMAVRSQYEADWVQWPVDRGAPFIDRNGNGVYDPPPPFGPTFTVDSLIAQGRDEPGVAGADPNKPADQVIWTVYNDLDSAVTQTFSRSNPIGLEIQKTMWAYNQPAGLTEVAFARVRIINKGGIDTSVAPGLQRGAFWIDSMFVGIWSDPDIGDPSDDLAGCDVGRSMGFVFNGHRTDDELGVYKRMPPAVGYDLLAGPAVPAPGDSGFFNLRRRYGIRNLGMTAFAALGTGDVATDPAPADYDTTVGKWWKVLRGFAPLGTLSSPDVPYPSGPHPSSPYRYSGDPMQLTGHVDGLGTSWSYAPGDRRILMSSGPFRMAPGDTQEVSWCVTFGLFRDARSSIGVMKLNADMAQTIFDRQLQFPTGPSAPKVIATPLDRKIILNWGYDPDAIRATESRVLTETYEFEGYTVYQLPSASARIEQGVRIATFDLVNGRTVLSTPWLQYELDAVVEQPVQIGTDNGVRRFFEITQDLLNGPVVAGVREPIPLANGRECHFAVEAYNVNVASGGVPSTVSSIPARVSVKPAVPFGKHPKHWVGDTLTVVPPSGTTATRVVPIVVDPLAGQGDSLQVRFSGTGPTWQWSIVRSSSGEALLSGETNQSGDERYPIVQGVLVKVLHDTAAGPPAGPADVYSFVISAPQQSREVERSGVERIGLFPNPYYAWPTGPEGPKRQFITFNNLPQRAVIRIFNLAGHLVRTLRKDNTSQFLEWDLENEDGWLVAGGIYVCHVELPDLGTSKVLKAAIITAMPGVQ